ncbi:ABC-2 type transport system permease protein [Glaciihabitans tibetensis]|uniref:ABC-2 type transport system permease protein n=1 Tax=Glaciihabitans tibetensis TaxID=1266600 RepID=A0A2T0VH33_9MICO|nr:ABC transporter permease [Glaciihabitans tibetensis]PRY69485.1 ABC-2 type transport system permease protein [Glaciihabitans tibetensis]
MLSIATAELKMLLRNRLVAACAILIPLAFGAFLLIAKPGGESAGAASVIATLQVMIMIAMGVYVTATTTLAARRQTLMLKRLRSGTVSDTSILTGLVVPIILVSVIQIALVLSVLSFTTSAPENGLLLVLAVLLAEAMFVGFALATAGVTNSPEHAQVTTLPLFFLTLGAAYWTMYTGTEELPWVKRLLPGGGIAELISTSWVGGTANLLQLVVPSLVWVAIALYFARRMFRWEPRA